MGSSNANFWHTKNGSNIKFYHINLRKHSDNLRDPSAEYVTIHEYFHIWQSYKIGAFKVGRTRSLH